MKALEILKDIRNIETEYDHLKKHRFDQAIEELEDLENRSCETCKHFKPITRNEKYYRRCFFLGSIDLQYCSAFEKKEQDERDKDFIPFGEPKSKEF